MLDVGIVIIVIEIGIGDVDGGKIADLNRSKVAILDLRGGEIADLNVHETLIQIVRDYGITAQVKILFRV